MKLFKYLPSHEAVFKMSLQFWPRKCHTLYTWICPTNKSEVPRFPPKSRMSSVRIVSSIWLDHMTTWKLSTYCCFRKLQWQSKVDRSRRTKGIPKNLWICKQLYCISMIVAAINFDTYTNLCHIIFLKIITMVGVRAVPEKKTIGGGRGRNSGRGSVENTIFHQRGSASCELSWHISTTPYWVEDTP